MQCFMIVVNPFSQQLGPPRAALTATHEGTRATAEGTRPFESDGHEWWRPVLLSFTPRYSEVAGHSCSRLSSGYMGLAQAQSRGSRTFPVGGR